MQELIVFFFSRSPVYSFRCFFFLNCLLFSPVWLKNFPLDTGLESNYRTIWSRSDFMRPFLDRARMPHSHATRGQRGEREEEQVGCGGVGLLEPCLCQNCVMPALETDMYSEHAHAGHEASVCIFCNCFLTVFYRGCDSVRRVTTNSSRRARKPKSEECIACSVGYLVWLKHYIFLGPRANKSCHPAPRVSS